MTGYDMPLLGVRARSVYYSGAWWHSCRDRGGFWTDLPLSDNRRRWTTVHTMKGIPVAYGVRLPMIGKEA